jgi:hypothetical protein
MKNVAKISPQLFYKIKKTLEEVRIGKLSSIINVSNIITKANEPSAYLRSVNNECLVDYNKKRFRDTKYDSFFIKMNDEQLEEIWGRCGKIQKLRSMHTK